MIPRARQVIRSEPGSWVRTPTARDVPWRSLAVTSALLSVAYYLGAKIGFAFTLSPHPISILWPPNALLLAALLLTPPRSWWLLVSAVLPAHVAVELQSGVPPAMVVAWFASNCSEAVIGALCIRHFIGGRFRFDSFHAVGVFLVVAIVAPVLSSFVDAGFVSVLAWGNDTYWRVWRLRCFSNILAEVALVPVVVTWAAGG